MSQLTIFDAIQQRDTAIAQIERATKQTFTDSATNAVKTVGRMRQLFTTDDVWNWLAQHAGEIAHDNRAIGPVMSKLAKANVIRPTGEYRPSVRRHCAPIRVWTLV